MLVRKALTPIFALFVVVNTMSIVMRSTFESLGFDIDVLLSGNLILCAVTVISYILLYKGLVAGSTAGFLRSVYGSFMIKLFLFAIVVFAYARMTAGAVNKPSLFTVMFLYLVYTTLETLALLKLSANR